MSLLTPSDSLEAKYKMDTGTIRQTPLHTIYHKYSSPMLPLEDSLPI